MQECFESKDIGMLQEVVAKMDPKEAEHHIKRCIDSGASYRSTNIITVLSATSVKSPPTFSQRKVAVGVRSLSSRLRSSFYQGL